MNDEPSLPRLPAVSWNEETQSFSNNPKKRFRAQGSSASAFNSSDPAVFSSDDDPSVDNYVDGRKKRRYVGSWFHQQPVASSDSAFDEPNSRPLPKTRRTFKRQLDSGVWMGSDSTDDGFEELQLSLQPKLRELACQPALPVAAPRPVVSSAEKVAREVIQGCLDEGDETVDLSSMGLESLSNATFEPLANLSCIPIVAKDVPFENRDPSLTLLLSGNLLTRVPGAIFDLENLTVLSLRGCGLKELPPAIGRLTRLQSLNLAQNRLRYLPAELLGLIAAPGELTALLLQGNSFWQASELPAERPIDQALERPALPEDGLLKLNSCSELTELEIPLAQKLPATRAAWSGVAARFFGRSPVQFRDSSGHLCSDFVIDESFDQTKVPVEGLQATEAYATPPSSATPSSGSGVTAKARGSHVPSLLELAARSCYASTDLEVLGEYIPESLASLRAVLDRAVAQRAVGGYTCCRCDKTMVTPATEWLEWWQVARVRRQSSSVAIDFLPWSDSPDEQAVPFLRKGCSWGCAPEGTVVGTWAVKEI